MGYSPRATHTPVIYNPRLAEADVAAVGAHLFSHLFHVSDNEVVAFWVEESWKAPWVLEGDEMGFLGVVIEVHCAEGPDLLARHCRAVDALFEGRWQQCCPDQEEAAVSPYVELGHDAVDNVWLGGEDVNGVHVALRLATVLEALDVGDVGVEDVIFLDDVVYELLGVFVDDEDLPLRVVLAW